MLGLFMIIFVILSVPLQNKESNVLFLLFGTVTAGFQQAISYWFRTPQDSDSKNESKKDSEIQYKEDLKQEKEKLITSVIPEKKKTKNSKK